MDTTTVPIQGQDQNAALLQLLQQILTQQHQQQAPKGMFSNPLSAAGAAFAAATSPNGAGVIHDFVAEDRRAKEQWQRSQLATAQLAAQLQNQQSQQGYNQQRLGLDKQRLEQTIKQQAFNRDMATKKLDLDKHTSAAQIAKWQQDAAVAGQRVAYYKQLSDQGAWTPEQSQELAALYEHIAGVPRESIAGLANNVDSRKTLLNNLSSITNSAASRRFAADSAKMKHLYSVARANQKQVATYIASRNALLLKGGLLGPSAEDLATLDKTIKYYSQAQQKALGQAQLLHDKLTGRGGGDSSAVNYRQLSKGKQERTIPGRLKQTIPLAPGQSAQADNGKLQNPGQTEPRTKQSQQSYDDLIPSGIKSYTSHLDTQGNIDKATAATATLRGDPQKAFARGLASSIGIDLDLGKSEQAKNADIAGLPVNPSDALTESLGELTGSFIGMSALTAVGLPGVAAAGVGMLGPEVVRSARAGKFSEGIDDAFAAFTSAQLGQLVGPKAVSVLVKLLGKTKAGKAINFGAKLGPKLLGGLKIASGGLVTIESAKLMGMDARDIVTKATPTYLFFALSPVIRSSLIDALIKSAKMRQMVNAGDSKAIKLLGFAKKLGITGTKLEKAVSDDKELVEFIETKLARFNGKPPKLMGLSKDEQQLLSRLAADKSKPLIKAQMRYNTQADVNNVTRTVSKAEPRSVELDYKPYDEHRITKAKPPVTKHRSHIRKSQAKPPQLPNAGSIKWTHTKP